MMFVPDYLEKMVEMQTKIYSHNCRVTGQCGFGKYVSIEDYVLKNGKHYTPIPFPKGLYANRKKKECYKNAFLLMMEHSEYTYVEGYATTKLIGNLPFLHAWVIDEKENVIDPTWEDGLEYYGVTFPRKFAIKETLAKGSYGIIDDWERGFPLLTGFKKKRKKVKQNEDLEIMSVIHSEMIGKETNDGYWKKQLNEMSDGTYLVEVYWFVYLDGKDRDGEWEKTFKTYDEAVDFFHSLTSILQVKKQIQTEPLISTENLYPSNNITIPMNDSELYETAREAQAKADKMNYELFSEGLIAKVYLKFPEKKWAIRQEPLREYPITDIEIEKMISLSPEEREIIKKGMPKSVVLRAAWRREQERISGMGGEDSRRTTVLPEENPSKDISDAGLVVAGVVGGLFAAVGARAIYDTSVRPKLINGFQKVIITIPHAKCVTSPNPNHDCDTSAMKFAKKLFRKGDRYLIGDAPRCDVDLNRVESAGTAWQKELSLLMETGDYGVLVDAHSFPSTSQRYGGYDIVFLYSRQSNLSDMIDKTMAKLKLAGYRTDKRVSLPCEDYILNKSLTKGIKAILVEVGENLTDEQLKEGANIVREGLPKKETHLAENPVAENRIIHAITYSCPTDKKADIGLCASKNPKSDLWRHEWKVNNPKLHEEQIIGMVKVSKKGELADWSDKTCAADIKSSGIGDYKPSLFGWSAEECKQHSIKPTKLIGRLLKIELLDDEGILCSCKYKCGKKISEWIPKGSHDLYTNDEGSRIFIKSAMKKEEIKTKVPAENVQACPIEQDFSDYDNVLVLWYSERCSHCQEIKKFITEVGVEVVRINVDKCMGLAIDHKIKYTPTVQYYRGGKVFKSHVGKLSKQELMKLIS